MSKNRDVCVCTPDGLTYGPFCCKDGERLPQHISKLIYTAVDSQIEGAATFTYRLPRISTNSIIVLTYPINEASPITAYIVPVADQQSVSDITLEETYNLFQKTHGEILIDKESLRENNNEKVSCYQSRVFVTSCSSAPLPPIRPPDDQPVVEPAEESPPGSFDQNGSVAVREFVDLSSIPQDTYYNKTQDSLEKTHSPRVFHNDPSSTAKSDSLPTTGIIEKASLMIQCSQSLLKSETEFHEGKRSQDEYYTHEERFKPSIEEEAVQNERDDSDGDKENHQRVSLTLRDNRMQVLRAHALEHFYNGSCFLKEQCVKPPNKKELEQIKKLVLSYENNGFNDSNKMLKDYIMYHCLMCKSSNCKIPHAAAGCLPPIDQPLHVSRSSPKQNSCSNYVRSGQGVFAQATGVAPQQPVVVYNHPKLERIQWMKGITNQYPYQGEVVFSFNAVPIHALDKFKQGQFPTRDEYKMLPPSANGKLVYCRPDFTRCTGLQFGASVTGLQVQCRIDKGGNGVVYQCALGGQTFAIKWTNYRELEVSKWAEFDHKNIIPLFGLITPSSASRGHVYQIMPRMTDNLYSEVKRTSEDGVLGLVVHMPGEKNNIFKNTFHVLKEIVSGLAYLHGMGIQHCDIKEKNVLISRCRDCNCGSIFLCKCTRRCTIAIADFDSVKRCNRVDNLRNTVEWVKQGTPFYRPLEAYLQCNDSASDMWSLGCVFVNVLLGASRTRIRKSDRCMFKERKYEAQPIHALVAETGHTLSLLRDLQRQVNELPNMSPDMMKLMKIITGCLHIDHTKRITAREVLETLSQ